MDIFDLAATLPNGLHDTKVSDIAISYQERTLRLRCDIWVGGMDVAPESREEYHLGVIVCADVEYCILDRPDPGYPFASGKNLTIDLVESDPRIELPGAGQAFRLWVLEWNAFVHVRAGAATLTWESSARIRTSGV